MLCVVCSGYMRHREHVSDGKTSERNQNKWSVCLRRAGFDRSRNICCFKNEVKGPGLIFFPLKNSNELFSANEQKHGSACTLLSFLCSSFWLPILGKNAQVPVVFQEGSAVVSCIVLFFSGLFPVAIKNLPPYSKKDVSPAMHFSSLLSRSLSSLITSPE